MLKKVNWFAFFFFDKVFKVGKGEIILSSAMYVKTSLSPGNLLALKTMSLNHLIIMFVTYL